MARVSQEHLDARRAQILDGAARCFARNGFHATSMQDVLQEVGLSAGAVYRYFRGKDEIIVAIATEVVRSVSEGYAEAAALNPAPSPDELIGMVMRSVLGLQSPPNDTGARHHAHLVIQVWAETLRNRELADILRETFAEMRVHWVKVVEAYQKQGLMRDDVPAEHVARTMIALAQGFVAQAALLGEAPIEEIEGGLRALMSMHATG
ncbi:TetR/AcrR family transcriptional regulator [Streptomyces beijiangensis]|uniref:TetR/AcrR family transcriptional regulator n=1 Tax=Streptomyces beijiangensis TaxID=163361 RepID=A0A939F613_9ACTN|nr:TetR/AcrR family transcriptional regulator [Streptomyces beijiangensis]MBO0512159.1 TetR/AcrR family transcriptional regulator [Streptomyces beijiangensis]